MDIDTDDNLEKTKRTISIVAGFSRNTKQTTNEKLNLIPVDVQKADKCAKIAKTDEGKGFDLRVVQIKADLHFQPFSILN